MNGLGLGQFASSPSFLFFSLISSLPSSDR